LAFQHCFCDVSAGCGYSWDHYYMTIRDGQVSKARAENSETIDGEPTIQSTTTFTAAADLFDHCGDHYVPPFRVQCEPAKPSAEAESSKQQVEVESNVLF
jgi:hypothetical protein